jgi:pimeloyl-ACP methyl ester carboxylesterase
VVGFGGYCDLERTILFQLTGRHDWEGEAHRLRPDPYGRWIVAANYLTCVPGFEDAREAADGLREMAALAGDVGVISWDPSLDAAKEEIRARIPAGHQRDAFSFFCPTRGADPDGEEAVAMAHALAAAARRADPDIEPAPQLRDVPGPVHLLHGQQDHLIPFTELHRLHAALPPHVSVQATVTPLFGHSSQDPFPGVVEGVRETARFLRALDGVLGVIEKPPAR